MLSSLRLALLAAVLASALVVEASKDAKDVKDLEEAFEIVNKYLVDNVPSDDIDENLAKVQELYEEEEDRRDRVQEAAGALIYVAQIFDEQTNKCNEFSYWALGLLNGHTKGAIEKEQPETRVEKIARHFATKHAEECKATYEPQLKAAMESFPKDKMEKIDAYLELGIEYEEPSYGFMMDGVTTDYALNFKVAPGTAEKAYETLMRFSKEGGSEDEQILHKPAKEEKIGEMFHEYFDRPCNLLYQAIAGVVLPDFIDRRAVTHEELPEIYLKFIKCSARKGFNYSGLVKEIASIVDHS